MGFSLLLQNTRALWKEWEMRLLVLLSLVLQLILATQVRKRKFLFRNWLQVMIWTTYLSADSVATLALSILSSRLANIQETKGTINPKSQITAFWAPFLLLHLGGPDMITAYVQEDNDLWLRQLARLCIQVGLASFIYFMALSWSTLWMLAAGMILMGFMKYVERILSLYLASKGRLQDSMLALPNFVPTYPRIDLYALRKEEDYRIELQEVTEVSCTDDFPVESSEVSEGEAKILFKAYELFKIFKLLFWGFIHRFDQLDASKRIFMDEHMDPGTAFGMVEIELGFMYDLLYTKAPLLNCAWGIIRWVINLSVLGAVLVFFSLQDKKDYAKVDICITFLLISGAILVEIYSLLLAISSDWVDHWWIQRLGRSAISFLIAFRRFYLQRRWSNSVAQFSLLGLSAQKTNRIFLKYPVLAKLDEKLVIPYIDYHEFKEENKAWIFSRMRETVRHLERNDRLKNVVENLKLEAEEVLKRSKCDHLIWSLKDMEFDQSILIWHIATELCYYKDRDEKWAERDSRTAYKMSKLVSRYMLYLILLRPSMLPTGLWDLRYKDTFADAQKFLEGKLAVMSENRGGFPLVDVVVDWVKKLFKEEKHVHTGCQNGHKSKKSRDLCKLCRLLLPDEEGNLRRGNRRSVLADACHLASQLNNTVFDDSGTKWDMISKVWANRLIYVACQCRGPEHSESLSRGGELLSHVWLLMAHLGVAKVLQTFELQRPAIMFKK